MADVQVGNLLKLEIDGVSEALMFHKFDPPKLVAGERHPQHVG